jgi:protein TonB
MNSNAILKSDVLDIIFENRNKSYGAYTLRKFYNNRLYKALGATLLLVIALCGFALLKKDNPELLRTAVFDNNDPTFREPPKHEPEKPKEPKAEPKPVTPKATAPATPTQVLASNVKITNNPSAPEIKDFDDSKAIGSEDKKGVPGTPEPIVKAPEGPAVIATPAPVIDKITPTASAEVMPEYPGGIAALRKFLEKNLSNPEELEEGKEVAVKIRFIVGYDGVIKGFETVQDGGRAFNNEVVRVLKKMPQWIPGKTHGENVSVYYTIPVKFTAAPAE